jgi:protein disulfide-isomerase A1
VYFTRINVDLNEIDNLQIDNYPHVKLYKSGTENPFTLYDQKTEEGLIGWLRSTSSHGEIFGRSDL